ncbi:zinc ribbon domain-containing protein [Citricoccus nitrophenolicus]|uniref:zinc ribbon domain-containing protein n=1 Tax=Citricoccus nitrophenolicus TaxID=863575 RepID=UPI0031EBA754
MSITTASPADQVRLLDLQQLDTALDRARHRMQQLRQDPEYARLQQALADQQATAEQTAAVLEDAREEVRRSEARVAEVQTRRDRNQARLDAGQGSAKDLENMMHELDTLKSLQDEHEGTELEAMEAAEQAENADAQAQQDLAAARAAAQERGAHVKGEAAAVAAEGNDLTGRRKALAATLPEDLVARYDKIRERNGGIGAARLVGNTSEASGMPISPADLAQIEQAEPQTLVYCPDSGAILVRAAAGDTAPTEHSEQER